MEFSREDARLLGKVAFLGMWQGRFLESAAIFEALHALEPHRIGPLLGLGMLCIHKGDFQEAVRFFENKVLPLDPQDEYVRAWLGLALMRSGQTEKAKEWLQPLAEQGKEADAKALARELLAQPGI